MNFLKIIILMSDINFILRVTGIGAMVCIQKHEDSLQKTIVAKINQIFDDFVYEKTHPFYHAILTS